MEDCLKIENILDFCDVPQLFVARDVFDTLYLCLLYDDEPLCRYTGIRISLNCLTGFQQGDVDLRTLFQQPETPHEYYDVVLQDKKYRKTPLPAICLPEEKLPAAGYTFSGDTHENIVVSLPAKDRNLLTELVRKFGWACM